MQKRNEVFDHRRYLVTGRGFVEGSSREAVPVVGHSRGMRETARHHLNVLPSCVFIV
mgnify:CR=1 FL=1